MPKKPLPPYGRAYLALHPDPGLCVATGPGAWAYATRRREGHCLVCPDDADPQSFTWPTNGTPALIREFGPPDDDRLTALAAALLGAGAPSVVALRHALVDSHDCRVFFEAAS